MKQYARMKRALLAVTILVTTPCRATPSLADMKDRVTTWWANNQKMHTPVIATGAILATGALIRLIWWLAQDRRSDEQVVIDTQRLCQATTDKYNRMLTVLEQAQLSSHKTLNEFLLVKFIDTGVDQYYLHSLDNALSKLNKEDNTLSTRIVRTKSDDLCKRMKVIQQDIFGLVTRLNGLSSFIHYHIGYIELYKTAATLQETYGQARACKHSQPELVAYVHTNASLFTAYPYFDFVEKIERAINSLKSHLRDAAYAQSTDLVHDTQELLNDLMIIKGTVASTREYRDDVHKREIARIKLEKEAAERARIEAEKQRLAMAATAALAQAQAEQNRVALERERLEEQKKAKQLQEKYLQQQKLDLERAKIAAQNEALQREQARLEREHAAAQKAHYDAWQQAQHAAAHQKMPEPSAPPLEDEEVHNYGYQAPEPSAPPVEKEEDLDALFAAMDKELKFETQETEQFQKDHGIEDLD